MRPLQIFTALLHVGFGWRYNGVSLIARAGIEMYVITTVAEAVSITQDREGPGELL